MNKILGSVAVLTMALTTSVSAQTYLGNLPTRSKTPMAARTTAPSFMTAKATSAATSTATNMTLTVWPTPMVGMAASIQTTASITHMVQAVGTTKTAQTTPTEMD